MKEALEKWANNTLDKMPETLEKDFIDYYILGMTLYYKDGIRVTEDEFKTANYENK